MASKRPKRKPATLAEWKEREGLTDEAIAARIRARGVEVKRAMISHVISGRRTAGVRLALALSDEAGVDAAAFCPSITLLRAAG